MMAGVYPGDKRIMNWKKKYNIMIINILNPEKS
jgi:hypothetical protein